MFQLDRIEETARLQGVSCSSVWEAKWRDLNSPWGPRSKPENMDWKQMCLESYLHTWLFQRTPSQSLLPMKELSVAAKNATQLTFYNLHGVQRLASEKLQPILALLEGGVQTLSIRCTRLLTDGQPSIIFLLHRLLDHGSIKKIVVKRADDSPVLWWITSKCQGPCAIDNAESKCPKLQAVVDEYKKLCPCCKDNPWPEGQIKSMDLEVASLSGVLQLLPSWVGLHSLHLCTPIQPACRKEVVELVESFRKLFQNPHCSLKALSLGNMCLQGHLASLLTACPTLHKLALEITSDWDGSTTTSRVHFSQDMKLSLEELTLNADDNQTTVEGFAAVVQHAPYLSTLHITGIAHATSLFRMLPESNPLLKVLMLEDINLADCQSEINNLLENSILQELSFKDCRLVEKCRGEKDLAPFIASAKKCCSLQTLRLPQNRLSSSIIQLADLFSEPPSKIIRLDLSANYILPADLLKFSCRIKAYRPRLRFTLDLRSNPLHQAPRLKDQACHVLSFFCDILTDG